MLGILFLAASLRFEVIGTRSLWQDEAFSLEAARRGVLDLLDFVRGSEAHPPGYYLLLSLWLRVAGDSLAGMRALSAAFGLAGVVLTWRLGRELFSPAVGVAGAALVAVNPFQIIASNELRMYLPLECAGLAATWALWRAGRATRPGTWAAAYGAFVAAAAYASYYAFLLVPAHAAWLWATHRQRLATVALPAVLTAAVLYAPWVVALTGGTLAPGYVGQWRGPMTFSYVPDLVVAQTFGGYVFSVTTYFTSGGVEPQYYGILLFPFLALAGAGAAALGRIDRTARSLVLLSWAVPVAVVITASLVAGYVTAYKYHLNFLQPFAALLVGAGIVHLRDEIAAAPRALTIAGTALVVAAFIAPAVDNLQANPAYQSYRYDQAARLVKALYREGDTVVFLPLATRRAFGFYFNPPGKTLGIPVTARTFDRDLLREPVDRVAANLGPQDLRVWLVYSTPLPEGTLQDLVAAVEARGYRRVIFHDFAGVFVGLMVRPLR